jgi:hypothetical protein
VLLLHDLQGDVVGEAAISETETKLLKSYNSTEFGVPSGKEAPPKYAWLGAAGVAGELPSGVITQDGVTYVPQTGRPLQTGGIAPPIPINAATPFANELPAWVAETAATEGAQQVAHAHQEKEATEKANQPVGQVPSTEGETQNGEEEFGDPYKCYVGGTTVADGDQGSISGYGGCNHGLPQGTIIVVCIAALSEGNGANGGRTAAGCNEITVKNHTSRHWSIGDGKVVHCESGEIIRSLVIFYVPGGHTLYAGTENGGECGGPTDEADEAALTLFGSDEPGGADAVELLLAIFKSYIVGDKDS